MATILVWDRYSDWEVLAEKLASDGHTIVWADRPELIKKLIADSRLTLSELIGELIAASRPALVVLNARKNARIRWDALEEIKRKEPGLPVLVILDPFERTRDNRVSLADGWVTRDLPYDELKEKIWNLLLIPEHEEPLTKVE